MWTELKRGSDGVSFTLYETKEDDDAVYVVDETWWTWDEFLEMDIGPEMDFGHDDGPVTTLGDPDYSGGGV